MRLSEREPSRYHYHHIFTLLHYHMTQEEIAIITQIATQAAINAISAKNVQVSHPVARASRPKALPDVTATAIGDIVANARTEAVKNGKAVETPAGRAIIMEYSEKQFAIWGDTKPYKEVLKRYGAQRWGIIWGYKPQGIKDENKANGWYISKAKLEEEGGLAALMEELEAAGLSVSEGESLRAKTEAHRAKSETEKTSKPKETTKPKIVPLPVQTPSYEGVGYKKNGVVTGMFSQHSDNHDLYLHTDEKGKTSVYICIGETADGMSAFLFVTGKVSTDGTIENYSAIAKVAEEGFVTAVANGTISKVQEWQIEAFKKANEEAYEWLLKHECRA